MANEEKTGLEALVSAMGSGFELVKKLANAVKDEGGTEEDLRKLLDDNKSDYLASKCGRLLVGKLPLAVLDIRDLDFWVDPGDGDIARLIREAKFYRHKFKVPIEEVRFKSHVTGPARVKIAEFRQGDSIRWNYYPQVCAMARKQKQRLAPMQHLLAFVGKYPSVAQQVILRYTQEDVYASIYSSTLRLERGSTNWSTSGVDYYLVMAD